MEIVASRSEDGIQSHSAMVSAQAVEHDQQVWSDAGNQFGGEAAPGPSLDAGHRYNDGGEPTSS
jgi:hypothetical protein